MKKITVTTLLVGMLATLASLPTLASPIRATFNGTVSGSDYFTQVLSDFPIGTAASFDVTFDDSNLLPSVPLTSFNLAPVSGTVSLGSDTWTLNAGSISSYSWSTGPGNPVLWYQLQLTGTGPTISNNGTLFGLFMQITPTFDLFSTQSLAVGFGYPVGDSATFYSYAELAGTFAAGPATSVPEPSTAFLMLPIVALFIRSRRKLAIK